MNKMVRVKDTIISESAPNDPKVGWITIAAEALNVTINTDGREKSSAMSGVSYLACKPNVKTINLTAGANISIFPSGPLSLTGSGNKLVQFTFVKTSEGIAYEVYVSKLGEDF